MAGCWKFQIWNSFTTCSATERGRGTLSRELWDITGSPFIGLTCSSGSVSYAVATNPNLRLNTQVYSLLRWYEQCVSLVIRDLGWWICQHYLATPFRTIFSLLLQQQKKKAVELGMDFSLLWLNSPFYVVLTRTSHLALSNCKMHRTVDVYHCLCHSWLGSYVPL